MPNSTFTDQINRKLELNDVPKRIVCLVPSLTELLFDLGVENEVVGITFFCIHPKEKVGDVAKIGGTKTVKIDKVRELKPDLVIASKEENIKEQIEAIEEFCPVWVSDVVDLTSALEMIKSVGQVLNKNDQAANIIEQIAGGFMAIAPIDASAIYLIWRKPWMCAGNDTFIHDVMQKSGFRNVIVDSRYPQMSDEEIRSLNPDFILLSSEPYPFKRKHIEEVAKIASKSKVVLVDGEMFSWYGSRLLKTPNYINRLNLQLRPNE